MGGAIHNFVDGIILADAFLVSVPVGVATGRAIISHEIPQEVGNPGILLESGFSRTQAFTWNLLSSFAVFPGCLVGLVALDWYTIEAPFALAGSAAGFLYIRLADLVVGLSA